MRYHVLALPIVAGVVAAIQVLAQAPAGDEAAIRAAIAALPRADVYTADSIFFSGGLVRPFVRGLSTPEPTTRAKRVVAGSEQATTQVRRIEIAKSGELAYEFSDGTVTRRMKAPDGSEEPVTFNNSTLRVWKKVDGRWLVAAHFAAPHGDRQ